LNATHGLAKVWHATLPRAEAQDETARSQLAGRILVFERIWRNEWKLAL